MTLRMSQPTAPFRADHVGSLLRPAPLLAARDRHKQGLITTAELRAAEDSAIRDAVRMQHGLGLLSATDGEFRRASWHMDFLYQVGGVTRVQDKPAQGDLAPDNFRVQFRNEQGVIEFTAAALRVAGKLHFPHCIFAEDFAFLKSVTPPGVTPKLTIPSPSMMHYRGGRAAIDENVYPDLDEFWSDLGQVYARQVAALAALGCTYLQLDDTSLAYLNDPAQREHVTRLGGDGARQHLTIIRVVNAALANKPAGMVVTTHLCRGNFRSSWAASGGYDYVAEALFNELNVDGFFLEFDDDRSGGFEPLRFVPRGGHNAKKVVLGLITSKRPELETKDALKRRIDQAAKFIPLEQLCLSPQCGFSSTVEGNALTLDEQSAKLARVVEVAHEVWP